MRRSLGWITGIIICLQLLTGCDKDACVESDCQNGGVCESGFCRCPDGFAGTSCEVVLSPCAVQNCHPTRSLTCEEVTDELARCICREGYEGPRCEQLWTQKFVGDYICTQECGQGQVSFGMKVTVGREFNRIALGNFANENAEIAGKLIDPNVFEIYEQYMTFGVISGAGSILPDGKIELFYTLIARGDTSSCVATLVR
ncbi:MAG: hypothetical protein SF053_02680 [Bacteroidia bacterium]|nr:hypothetical protein [Bacteroidia bacterium]